MYYLRASSLGTFKTCPYKYKYDQFEIDPQVAYLGDIIHFLARTPYWKEYFLDAYHDLDPDITKQKYMDKLVDKVRQYMSDLSTKYEIGYEVPFRDITEEYVLQGTADAVLLDIKKPELIIIDFKTSGSSNWYEGEDIWNESMQPAVYTYLAMKVFGINKAKFRYVVLEKKNTAKLITYEREFKFNEVEKEVHNLIQDYIYAEEMDDWEARSCRYCNFCKLKNECPLYQVKVNLENNEEF